MWMVHEALLQGECSIINNRKSNSIGPSVAAYIAFLTALEARTIQDEGSSMDTIMEGTEGNHNNFISFMFSLDRFESSD